MNTLSRNLLTVVLATAVGLATGAARDHDDEPSGATARVKFSDPSKPGTLKLSLPWAEARVTATDGNEIVVTSTLEQKGHREVDNEGFRRIDEDMTFELVEKNNVATVIVAGDNAWVPQGAEFEIQVPRNTNLILRTEAGGDIEVTGSDGDIDIQSMNGEVRLNDISSSAVVNTMNGEIHATFRKAPGKPVSLSSMNGEIDLRLPGDTKANLRMRTHNGSIRTNFAEGALQTKTEKTSLRIPANLSPDSREYQEYKKEIAREQARADRELAKAQRERDRALAAARAGEKPEKPEPAEAPEAPEAPEAAQAPRVNTHVVVAVNGDTVVAPVVIPPIPPMPNFGGKSIVGTLNGGGVDIKLTSMNGTITLRESKKE
jgi:hypothetical protein